MTDYDECRQTSAMVQRTQYVAVECCCELRCIWVTQNGLDQYGVRKYHYPSLFNFGVSMILADTRWISTVQSMKCVRCNSIVHHDVELTHL